MNGGQATSISTLESRLPRSSSGSAFPVESLADHQIPESPRYRSVGSRSTLAPWTRGAVACANAAYIRADADDRFWAARKLMAMTDAMITAAVQSGQLSDNAAEDYI